MEKYENHLLISHTSSLLPLNLLVAHHLARCINQAFLFSSFSNAFSVRQNRQSCDFWRHSAM